MELRSSPVCCSPPITPLLSTPSDGEDGLYLDSADRARLEAMTELDREMILSDRAEERDKLRQRKALLKSAKGAADKVGGRMGVKSSVCGGHNAPMCPMHPLRPMRPCGTSARCTHVPHAPHVAIVCFSCTPAGPSMRRSLCRANPCPRVELGATPHARTLP